MGQVLLALTILAFPMLAKAEFRAYVLAISKEGNTRQITTNFDQDQYVGVHPLDEGESIELVSTWMCWQSSQGEGVPICQDPKNPQTSGSDDRNSASE